MQPHMSFFLSRTRKRPAAGRKISEIRYMEPTLTWWQAKRGESAGNKARRGLAASKKRQKCWQRGSILMHED